ncbi:MAG: HipA N-terminal domain-containing protein [Rectinemataceae bacterium]
MFSHAEEWLGRSDAWALSHSLPLRNRPYSQAACLPFFSGLLPDGELRRRLAEWLLRLRAHRRRPRS